MKFYNVRKASQKFQQYNHLPVNEGRHFNNDITGAVSS